QQVVRGQTLRSNRGVRRAEIDRAVDDLGDASARADALIVQGGTAGAFVLLTPFRVDRGRESGAGARDFLSVGSGNATGHDRGDRGSAHGAAEALSDLIKH